MRASTFVLSAFLPAFSLFAAACGAGPCLRDCTESLDFFQECMADDGTLCGGDVVADCVDDARAWQDCQDQGWEGDECDFDTLEANGVVHACNSPADAVRSCRRTTRASFRDMDAEQKAEAREECRDDGDEWSQVMETADCDAFCAFFE